MVKEENQKTVKEVKCPRMGTLKQNRYLEGLVEIRLNTEVRGFPKGTEWIQRGLKGTHADHRGVPRDLQ